MGNFLVKKVPSGIKFYLKAENDEVVLTSEVYKSMASCKDGIASVIKNANGGIEDLTDKESSKQKHPKFELYENKKGEFRFRLKATNGQIIGTSDVYKTKEACVTGIESVKKNVQDAKIVEEDVK